MAIESLLPGGLTIQAIIDQTIGSVTGKSDADLRAIGTAIDSVKNYVADNVPNLPGEIGSALGSALSSISTQLGQALTNMSSSMGAALTASATQIGNLISAGTTQVNNIVAGLKTGFDANITSIQNGIGDLVVGVQNAYRDASLSVKTAIDNAIKNSTQWITNAINGARDNTTNAINATKSWLDNAISLTKTSVSSAIDVTKTSVTAAINNAKENSAALATSIKSGISDLANTVGTSIGNTVDATGQWLSDAFNATSTAIQNLTNTVGDWIADEQTVTRDSNLATSKLVQDSVTQTSTDTRNSIEGVYNAVSNYIGDLIEQLKIAIQSIADSLTKSWNDLRDWYVNDFQTWLDDFDTNVGNFFKDLPENAQTWWGDFTKSLQTDNKTMGNAFTRLLAGESGAALEIVTNANPGTQQNYFAGLFYGIATLGPIMSATAQAIVTPAAEELLQASWLNNPVKLLPPDMLVTAMLRNAYPEAQTKTDIQAQGYKGSLVDVMQAALKPLLSAADIQKAYLLKRISPDEANTRLKHIGFNNDEASLIIQNTEQLLSANELVSAFRRRLVSDTQAVDEMGRQGLDRDRAEVLLGLAETLPQPQDVQLEFIRGFISEPEHDSMLGRIGYSQEQIELLKKLYNLLPPVQDLIRMAVREVFSPDIAQRFGQFEDYPEAFSDHAKRLGLSEEWAKAYWAAHWDLPSPQMGFEMLHRSVIDQDELKLLMRALDIMPYWRDRLIAISYNPLTRVDVRRMYGLQVLDREGVKRAYLDLGYNDTNAELMTEFTVRYESQGDADEQAEIRALTRSVIESAYSRGIIDRQDAIVRLSALLYQSEDINLLLSIWDYNISVKNSPDRIPSINQRVANLVSDAYTRQLMGQSEAVNMLQSLGYSASEASAEIVADDYEYTVAIKNRIAKKLVDLGVTGSYPREDIVAALGQEGFNGSEINALLEEVNIERGYRNTRPSVTQFRDMWLKGIIDDITFAEELENEGYPVKYARWLMQLWEKVV